ncbi:TPA: hypothetical protein L4U31_002858 [Pseudomonas aeruginosa]|nr:hypothetical protein [Pseudomonas aeruginosa]
MATLKGENSIVSAPAPPPAVPGTPGEDDLQVLHPDITVTVAGQSLVVREYGFVEGLQLRPRVQPLLDDLYALLKGEALELEQIVVVLGKHAELTIQLVAQAANVDVGFVQSLNQVDGQRLLMAWWTANGPFYVRGQAERVQVEAAVEKARLHAGATSTQPSSQEDTEASSSSAG